MNYYIDFDNTMFCTANLKPRMFDTITQGVLKQNSNLKKEHLLQECKAMFNRENIYDIYKLIKYFSKKYSILEEPIICDLNYTILNSADLVFEDVIPFLKKLKENNHKLYILSFAVENLYFQNIKIVGSGLIPYFDGVFTTSTPKYELDIDYTGGIFIDDNPKDLLGLYSKCPKQVIRMRKKESSYSIEEIKNVNIKEYSSFNEISII